MLAKVLSADHKGFIEPSPDSLPSHHEYPEYSEEFTPYPFFPTGRELNKAGAAPGVDPGVQQGAFPQPQQATFDFQGPHPYPQFPPSDPQGFPQPLPHPFPPPEQFGQLNGFANGVAQTATPSRTETSTTSSPRRSSLPPVSRSTSSPRSPSRTRTRIPTVAGGTSSARGRRPFRPSPLKSPSRLRLQSPRPRRTLRR